MNEVLVFLLQSLKKGCTRVQNGVSKIKQKSGIISKRKKEENKMGIEDDDAAD